MNAKTLIFETEESGAFLTRDVVRIMNLDLFPELCLMIGLRDDGTAIGTTDKRLWELYSPVTQESVFRFQDVDGRTHFEFCSPSHPRALHISDGHEPSKIEVRNTGEDILWRDEPIVCSDETVISIQGSGFESLYKYVTGKQPSECREAVEQYSANPFELKQACQYLFETA